MASNIEIERKYIIKKPDFSALRYEGEYTESKITQIYLKTVNGVTHRIRKRVYSTGKTEYTENKKTRIDYMSCKEEEREISEREYLSLCAEIEEGTSPLEKTRRTFLYGGLTVEIDEYPFFEKCCVMEIELPTAEISPTLPPFIKVISDVTGDKSYSNHAMAKRIPKEPYL